MSNKLNIEVKQGEDFYRLLTIKDENGTGIDLTGFVFSSQIREKTFSKNIFLSFSFVVDPDQVTNAGQVSMSLAASLSSAKTVNKILKYSYDVEMNSGSTITRIMEGVATITPEVTK